MLAAARTWLVAALALSSLGGGPPPAWAQAPAVPIYTREAFTYPVADRRDPFQPLRSGSRSGPRFRDLALSGVLYNPRLGSVATLTDRSTGRRYRAREGDRLGEVWVEQIWRGGVDFLISSFGVTRRETLRVRREREVGG